MLRSSSRAGSAAVVPIAIVLLALLLRLHRLDGQSLWYDEAFSIAASRLPLREMLERITADARHAPLHFLVLRGWLDLLGTGALQARLLSAVLSTGAVGFAWLLAARLFDRRTAHLAALLLALSQLDVLYAQEARMYAQLACLVGAAAWLFATALLERRASAWWLSVVASALAVGTHYYAALFVLALVLFAWTERQRHPLPRSWWLGGLALGAAILAPWLIAGFAAQVPRAGLVLAAEPEPWFAVSWRTPLAALNQMSAGQIAGIGPDVPWWTVPAGLVLFTAPALLALRAPERGSARLCALLWLVPLAAALLLGALFRFQFATRYVLPCLAPYLILVARGLLLVRPAWLRSSAIVLVLGYSAVALRANYADVYKPQWREVLARLAEGWREGDCCVFLPAVPLEWGIYHPDEPRLRVVGLEDAASGPCERVWLVAFVRTAQQQEDLQLARRGLIARYDAREELDLFRVALFRFDGR